MTYQYINIKENKDGIFELILNNAKAKNALNKIMIYEIIDVLKSLKSKSNLRILVITGEGDCFSAGADLAWMKDSVYLDQEDNKKDALDFAKMLYAIDNFSKPTLSLVNGEAYGGALGIICTSDFSIALNTSKFCFSEVKLGLIPAMIGPYVLRTIGFSHSKKLFLTGEVFDAKHALNINLIDASLNSDDINKKKDEIIKNLLIGGPRAQTEIKKFLLKIYSKDINQELINSTAKDISRIRTSKEGQEGLKAFLSKRKPRWLNEYT